VRQVQPRTIALRHQLLAALRNADGPLSTNALCTLVARDGDNCGQFDGRCASQIERCHGGCWWTRVYPQLRALQRMGLVDWVHYPRPIRCTYWRYIEAETEEMFNAAIDAMDGES
jgi:hypothetical protein